VSVSDDRLSEMAMMVAYHVRNVLEDFHVKHLSDEQMAELNPLVRNGIYEALYALTHDEPWCASAAASMSRYPEYWERPKFTDSVRAFVGVGNPYAGNGLGGAAGPQRRS